MSGYEGSVPTQEQQRAAICAAVKRAGAGDVWGMLQCLHETNVLVALKRSIQKRWPGVPEEEIDHLIGEAVDALGNAARDGRHIENPVGFMLKVMHRKAYDYAEIRRQVYALDPERDGYEPEQMRLGELDAADPEAQRAQAVAIAWSLLSKLGQQSIQAVMSYVFAAVEAGQAVVTNEEIVDATGLSPATVRQSLSRGWRRLERIAGDENVASLDLDLGRLDAHAQEE